MKVGFACGVFDLFHLGHLLMLKECKMHCDYLLIALNSGDDFSSIINPNKNMPIFSIIERVAILQNSRYVDEVITYKSEVDLLNILKSRKINIRFLGDDYIGKPITGSELNIEIHFIDRSHGISTSKLIKKIINQYVI
jgi:glycerol-3-phosphate cytidylyltransferase